MKNRMEEGTLHKWFKGSKSKDGKGGWVNVVTGGTCASDEPGEGTPKCVSSAKRASMSKAERLSAARRKKAADPGQQQKTGAAKPTYVSTDKKKMKKEEVEVMGENVSSGKSRIAKSGRVRGKVVGTVSNSEKVKERQQEKAKEKTKEKSAGEAAYKESSAKGLSPAEALYRKKQAERNAARERIKSKEKKEKERLKGGRFGRIREEVEVTEAKDKKGKGSGTKDACYHKVKSRYSVWPSAYASGALVKCRKVGAKNWGNKSESKDHEYSMARSQLSTIINAAKRLKEKMKGEGNIEAWVQSKLTKAADYIDTAADYVDSGEMNESKKCWKGYEKKGTKKMFGKTYNNCVKKEGVTFTEFRESVDKSKMKCNKPKAQAVGDSKTGKSHVVKACEDGKEKIIRFGQRGVKGSPKKEGESKEYAARRKAFKDRHAKNIAKGKMSAAYWANKVKW